jgi:hypothetical protein
MKSSTKEIKEVKKLLALDSDETLDNKLRGLHQRKLMPCCLLSPQYREKVDELVALIIKEKRQRRQDHTDG